jgi:hypothetical protein
VDLGGGSELCAWVWGGGVMLLLLLLLLLRGEGSFPLVHVGFFLFPIGAIVLVDTQIDISFDVMFLAVVDGWNADW